MFKFYADLFALTADSISAKSIRRLRWLTIGSLPLLPMFVFTAFYGLPDGYSTIPFTIVFLLSIICTFSVLFARIVNRVWALDKYLDEWEKDIKRKSMTMGFMAIMYFAMALVVGWDLFNDILAPLVSDNPKSIPMLILGSIVGIGIYTQIFTQISLIKPIEGDDLDAPEYHYTSTRSVLGAIAVVVSILFTATFLLGYLSGHQEQVVVHKAAQEVCGDIDVDTHKKTETAIDVVCEGSKEVIRLDLNTLKPI